MSENKREKKKEIGKERMKRERVKMKTEKGERKKDGKKKRKLDSSLIRIAVQISESGKKLNMAVYWLLVR